MVFGNSKAKSLYILIGLVITGLIGVQLYWISNSIRFQNETLERSLKEDLTSLVQQVEDYTYCFSYNARAYIKKGEGIYILKQKWDNDKPTASKQRRQVDTLNMYNVFYNNKDTFFVNEKAFVDNSYPATLDVTLKFSFPDFYTNTERFDSSYYNISNLNKSNFRDILTNKFTVDKAINVSYMDSLIKDLLLKNKLDTFYEAGIRKQGDTKFEYLAPGTDVKHLAGTNITATFFDNNNFNKPYELLLYIPASYTSVIGSTFVMLLSSILIIVFLVVSYIYFVRTIINQKKLSEMKNTFINNITHEFRTPITNIMLAVDNWRVAGNRRNGYYMDIIEEENRHLERNVEQILQIATLEYPVKNKKLSLVNMSELIEEVITIFHLQIINTHGKIEFTFNGSAGAVYADRGQMKNMLHNLVDNAIKYSYDPPDVTITTYDTISHLVIQVEDKGIGMSPETQKHIFKRFYRGYNGDTHDVKGFGLGLSYVKYIVDAHDGEIHVKSKPGKGTRFTIYLPKKNA